MVNKSLIHGLVLVLTLSLIAFYAVQQPVLKSLGVSPLIFGVVLGMLIGNLIGKSLPQTLTPGIVFSAKKLLRLAVVLYGFKITFQDIASVGLDGILVSAFMLASTFVLGAICGIKLLKLDRDTSLLIASGSSVCGAAAVLAAESTLNSKPYKTVVAVATVVLFGTVSMFLYPILYKLGWLDLNPSEYGLYIGGSVHEVAQVVAAADAIDPTSTDTAVIVKMTRVMMLAPLLIILALIIGKKSSASKQKNHPMIPWFAVLFIVVAGFNSLHLLSDELVHYIQQLDLFLLTMAMTALGLETHFSKFKQAGWRPLLLALILFLWLIFGGYGFIRILI